MKVIFIIKELDGGGGPQSTFDIMDSISIYKIESESYIFDRKKGNKYWAFFGFLRNLSKELPKGHNILLINSAGFYVGFIISLAVLVMKSITNKRLHYFQIYHNRIKVDHKSRIYNSIRILLSLFTATVSDKGICVSEGLLNEIKDSFKFSKKLIKKLTFIYNPTRSFKMQEKLENKYPYNGKIILSIGRLCHQKGFDTLINAFVRLEQQLSEEIHLVIVGDGEEREKLQKMADSHVMQNIHLWGYDDDIEFHYRNADVFVLPSRHEGFGLVLVEAMSFHIPVLSTNCPYGPSEILDGGSLGCLVPVNDSNMMCDGIKEILLYTPEQKKIIVHKAFEKTKVFNKKSVGEKYVKLINSLELN